MVQKEMGVEQTLTRVVMSEIKKGLLIEPRVWKLNIVSDCRFILYFGKSSRL
jgi:hypothetical protein